MAKYDPIAIEANARLRGRFGRTVEVEKAIKDTQRIRALVSGDMDYAETLARVYHQITGGNNGHPDGRTDSRSTG